MLMWKVLVTMSIITFMTNMWFYWYYKGAGPADNGRSIQRASLKLGVLLSVYTGCAIVVLKVFGSVNYRVDLLSVGIGVLDSSESNTMLEVEVPLEKKTMQGPVDWVAASVTPFVLLASLSFAICGGAGFAFLPLELIDRYIYRPRLLDPDEYIVARKVLVDESAAVIARAKEAYELERDLQLINPNETKKIGMKRQLLRRRRYEAKRAFIEFEEMQDDYYADENVAETNPIVSYVYLVAGIVFLVFSGVLMLHTFVSINGMTGVLEYILIWIESKSWQSCLGLFLLILIYLGTALLFGSFKVSQIVAYQLNSHPVRRKKTYANTFLLHINFCLCGFFGIALYLVRFTPRYMRYIQFDFFFNRVVVRTVYIHYIYRFKVFEYALVLSFLISIYVSFFINNGSFALREKIKALKKEIQAQKEKVLKMEKDPTNKLLAA